MALPRERIESVISRIEINLAYKPVTKQTQEEHEVLEEVQQIRKIWAQGNAFTPPLPSGTNREMSWQLLNGLHLLRANNHQNLDDLENRIPQFHESAIEFKNLFVILMSGGAYARRVATNGKLKRG